MGEAEHVMLWNVQDKKLESSLELLFEHLNFCAHRENRFPIDTHDTNIMIQTVHISFDLNHFICVRNKACALFSFYNTKKKQIA